ncbi:MAG: tyrosine-type recombinase/integrase [Bacteriovoracaceae bacterium]
MPSDQENGITSTGDFAVSSEDTKYVLQRLIRMLVIATNKHKLDYGSLRYIHRQVIRRSKLTIERPAKKLYELPTSEELERFFSQISDPQIRLLFSLIHNTGLRVAEVCSIKVSNIDFNNKTILVTGKGRKDRLVPITSRLSEKILLFLHGRNHKFLFESRLGTPFSTRRIEQLCTEFKVKAGIEKKLSPHSFRHFYFSKLAENGIAPDVRALLAGHSSVKTQEVYTHLGMAGVKDVILETLERMENEKIFK